MMNNNSTKDNRKTAVALEYEAGEKAPKIVATGFGHVAEKIIATAIEENVPVHKDEKLSGTLSKLSLGDYIPEELYGIVAEVLVMVDRAEGKAKRVIANH